MIKKKCAETKDNLEGCIDVPEDDPLLFWQKKEIPRTILILFWGTYAEIKDNLEGYTNLAAEGFSKKDSLAKNGKFVKAADSRVKF